MHRLQAGAVCRALGAGRAAQAVANLGGVELEFSESTAEGVAMHAEFDRGLALISFVLDQHLEDEAPLEFTHGFVVGYAARMHLGHKVIQISSHAILTRPAFSG